MRGGVAVLRNPCGWGIAHTHTMYRSVCLSAMLLSPCQSLRLERLTEAEVRGGCLQVVVKEKARNLKRTL